MVNNIFKELAGLEQVEAIARNYNLLCATISAYSNQIEKACKRNDRVSIIHRTTAFLESYFDIIFARNSLTHPGEKRLIELCKQRCAILPSNFEANLNRLFDDMLVHTEKLNSCAFRKGEETCLSITDRFR